MDKRVTTTDVVCPRCGHAEAELTPGSHVVHCVKCGKNFNPSR